jgi:hypothetical protein
MIRARESLDRWAVYAHNILDRVQRGAFAKGDHVTWALAYLGDAEGCTKIPADLQGGHRHQKVSA